MKHYLSAAGAAKIQAQIAAHRAHLAELRAQRPFRDIRRASNVVSIAAARRIRNPLLQLGAGL